MQLHCEEDCLPENRRIRSYLQAHYKGKGEVDFRWTRSDRHVQMVDLLQYHTFPLVAKRGTRFLRSRCSRVVCEHGMFCKIKGCYNGDKIVDLYEDA